MANMKVNLKIWRQAGPKAQGGFVTYENVETDSDTSFLETLDILNETLVEQGEEPIVFDHDCREGICGMCSLYINGHPHGPQQVPPPASSICVASAMAKPSPWNPGALPLSP